MKTPCGKTGLNIPDTLHGWVSKETLHMETREALYDYIDGGAEQFISYGYAGAVSKTFEKPGEPEVRAEIFDMQDSKNAYGIFSNIRYEENAGYGQGAQYVKGALFFWKDRYFINITTIEETNETESFIRQLAEFIQDLIPEPGEKPGILKVLPIQDLDRNGILYFHHYIWLNAYHFISNDNLFFIDDETDALLARYGTADERSVLLVIHYNNTGDMEKAYNNFISQYFTGVLNTSIFQTEDDRWMGLTAEKDFIIAVFNGITEKQVRRLIQETTERIRDLSGSI
ncbi:MAG: hypothetical protein JW723_02115 [Bacteroidales bacterium]|nr:hypothetical protein [Bacteroidales bacterium]